MSVVSQHENLHMGAVLLRPRDEFSPYQIVIVGGKKKWEEAANNSLWALKVTFRADNGATDIQKVVVKCNCPTSLALSDCPEKN